MQSGVTKWAIVIAIVYMAWSLIEVSPQIRSSPIALHTGILLYGLIQLSLDFFSDIFKLPSGTSKTSKYNLRIKGNGLWSDYSNYLYIIFLFVLPVLSQLFRDESLYQTAGWKSVGGIIEAQSTINCYILIFLIITFTVYQIGSSIYEKRKGFPFPITFIVFAKNENSLSVLMLLSLELAIGNAVAACIVMSLLPADLLKSVLTFSFDLALIILALNFLYRTRFQSEYLEKIGALERDIIFHELSDNEIKDRIQNEFIGQEFGEWLKTKINEVTKSATALNELSKTIVTDLEQIEALPRDFKYEQDGRLDKLLSDLETTFQNYQNIVQPLLNWLAVVVSQQTGAYQKHVLVTVNELFSELNTIHESTKSQTLATLENIREALRRRRQK